MKYEKQVIIGTLPSKPNSYKVITKFGHGSIAKQKGLIEYEKSFYMQCNLRDKNISNYFKIDVDVYHKTMSNDLDNGFKVLLDCLQSCKAIKNDNRCVEIHARKLIDKNNPRVEFVIEEVEL